MIGKGEQFHSMYTNPVWFRKIFQDCTHRAVYKHWNNWCCKKGHKYCFEKGYDEDYYKQYCENCRYREVLIDYECGFFNVCLMGNEVGKPCNNCNLIDKEKIKEFQERFGGDSE